MQRAIEEAQKREAEERIKREEEERVKKETEQRAQEEAERKQAELEEKLKKEEEERLARKKRIEEIMARTRGGNKGPAASPSGTPKKVIQQSFILSTILNHIIIVIFPKYAELSTIYIQFV